MSIGLFTLQKWNRRVGEVNKSIPKYPPSSTRSCRLQDYWTLEKRGLKASANEMISLETVKFLIYIYTVSLCIARPRDQAV